MDTPTVWLNTELYTPFELVLFAVGCFGWVVAYFVVIKNVLRHKFVEIPAGAVVANIAWEFVWGFLYTSDMGMTFAWGYRIWFFMDCAIVYFLFKYGSKQLTTPALQTWFRPAAFAGIVVWGFLIYFMVAQGYDTGYGAISGYVLNVMMSALYITLLLHMGSTELFSLTVGWSKMLGTALLSVFNYMVNGDMMFLMALCLVTLILDLLYIAALYWLRGQSTPVPAKA
jgi:hypothetical protein